LKERLTTLLLAVAALALFYVFFFPKPTAADQDTALPLSTEEAADGYQALWRWLHAHGIAVATLRQPYTELASATSALRASGNLLITTMPHRVVARSAELNALDEWIDKGNTLLVMAALDDTPQWAITADESFLRNLGRVTRIQFDSRNPAAKREKGANIDTDPAAESGFKLGDLLKSLEPQRILIDPQGSHPLFDGVHTILAVSEFPASHWLATPMDASPVLEIGRREADANLRLGADPAIWLKPQEKGQILVFSVASPFTNRVIADMDNARLFSNIVAWSVRSGGTVVFDDAHQGAVSYYDAKAFFRDPRLHRTLLWILAIWLVFVLGSQRLRPAAESWNPADVTAFIGVTGGFFASTLTRGGAAQQLFHNFFNAVRRDFQLPEDGSPIWERLEEDARVDSTALIRLRRLYDKTRSGKDVDLVQLHNMLTRLQGTLE
jgi:hypothetical protein